MSIIKHSAFVKVRCCSPRPSISDTNSRFTSTALFYQTPDYLPANTPCKKVLLEVNKSNFKEIKHLKKIVVSLSKKLANKDTVECYLQLSEKNLSPGLFSIDKNHLNIKNLKIRVLDKMETLNNGL